MSKNITLKHLTLTQTRKNFWEGNDKNHSYIWLDDLGFYVLNINNSAVETKTFEEALHFMDCDRYWVVD